MNDFDALRKLLEVEKDIKSAWDVVLIFEEEKKKFELKKAEFNEFEKKIQSLKVEYNKKKAEYSELIQEIKKLKKHTDVDELQKENSRLGQQILELELENAKLRLAIEDFKTDEELEKRGEE